MTNVQAKFKRYPRPNITHLQNFALRKLINHPKFIVVEADKNMGVCILEREHFITQVLREHVNNEETNKKLTLTKTNAKICHTRYLFHEFVNKHKEVLGEAVVTYMSRGYKKYGDKIAKFHASESAQISMETTTSCIQMWHST